MLQVSSLRIDYDDLNAVTDLDLTIQRGQIYGLVGPNGAGKTSTIKALAGILEPTYGEIKIDGIDLELNPQDALQRIGYMPDFPPVYENLKLWEYLDVFGAAYKIPARERLAKVKYWVEQVNLVDKWDSFIHTLSRGMRQRLILAKTLLHNPSVLLLDEPASGLDPIARKEMQEILTKIATQDKTILISSHILGELSDFCNAVGIMEKGRMIVSGSIEEIRARIGAKGTLIIRLSQENASMSEKLLKFLHNSQHASSVRQKTEIEFQAAFQGDDADASWLLDQLVKQGIPICHFYVHQDTVEDIFFKIGASQTS